jgi:prephenate dehydrogenase
MILASHLPQLAANGLARVIEDGGLAPEDLGPGGRDMTRLAASNPGMWRDVLRGAPPELPGALRALAAEITELAALVEKGDLNTLESRLARTRAWRAR